MKTEIAIPTSSLNPLSSDIAKEVVNGLKAYIDKLFVQKQEIILLTVEETCDLIGITRPTLLKYQEKGLITGYRLGTRTRFKKSEIEEALLKIRSVN